MRKLMWILWKTCIIPNVRQNIFLLRKISRVGVPKSTVLVIIFRVFMWSLSCGTNKNHPLAMFRNGIYKKKRSSYKGTMNNGTPLSSFDSEMTSKIQKRFVKNCHANFDKKMKFNCLSLKIDDDELFKNTSKRPTFVLIPFLTMLNLEVDKISLQKLE